MKTSDLSGPTLDYWVAKAEDIDVVSSGVYPDGSHCILTYDSRDGSDFTGCKTYSPSKNWAQGGLLIESKKLAFYFNPFLPNGGAWVCANRLDHNGVLFSGESILIAGMRRIVFEKFGDEVPDIAEGE